MLITNVRLPHHVDDKGQDLYSVLCQNGLIKSVERQPSGIDPVTTKDDGAVDGHGGLLLPSLCHSHIHLDKCYILQQGEPLIAGDFQEALRVTSTVKAGFTSKTDDLYARGKRLVEESITSGVTSMRAHVEVDSAVGSACLDVALRLHDEYKEACDVEVAIFMQDPLFDSEHDGNFGENAKILMSVLNDYVSHSKAITAIGSAPYVERTRKQQLANMERIISLAQKYDLDVDFHLDYDLKSCDGIEEQVESEPLIFPLLSFLSSTSTTVKSLTVGHITRLSVFTAPLIARLRECLATIPPSCGLRSITFVGLPQSDLYMMGRRPSSLGDSDCSFGAPSTPRGTLDIPRFRRFCDSVNVKRRQEHKEARAVFVNVAMSVNNVANAFTPQGTPDPLSLCPLGVAVYQDATNNGCRTLLESITTASKLAIGDYHLNALDDPLTLLPSADQPANFVILHDNHNVQSAVLSPCYSRTTIKDGKVVARRIGSVQHAISERA